MTFYALIKDGNIERVNIQLPTVINGVSIPLGATGLEHYSLYPITGQEPQYNSQTQRIDSMSYRFDGVSVVKEYTVVDIEPEVLADQLRDAVVAATQSRLDAWAKTRNYDGILSLCTYATSTVSKFAAEGQAGVNARDATWAKLYQILDDVKQGLRPVPSGYDEIEPELPVLQWPEDS